MKSEKIFKTDLKKGEIVENSRFMYSEKQYDENGNILLSATFNSDGSLVEKTISTFNDINQKISSAYYIDDNEISQKSFYEYGSDNQLVKETIVYLDESKLINSFLYQGGLLISSISFDPDENEEVESVKRVFDEKGHLLTEEKTEYGELSVSVKCEYDDGGNLISKKITEHKFEETTEEIYQVENLHVTAWAKIYPNKRKELYKNAYDENGKICSVSYTGSYKSETEYEYDQNGNRIAERERLNSDMLMYETLNEYDSGNRLKETQYYINRMGQAPDLEYRLEYVYE